MSSSIELDLTHATYRDMIADLHPAWLPHQGQIAVGESHFRDLFQSIFVQCGRKWGKCLDMNTLVPTTAGFKKMSDIKEGDYVFSELGKPIRVLHVFDPLYNRPCYEITFGNREKVICDDQHLWVTNTKENRKSLQRSKPGRARYLRLTKPTLKYTWELAETVKTGAEYNHSINRIPSIESDIKVEHPYLLGAWLGDGGSYGAKISSADEEILDQFRQAGFSITHYTKYDYGVGNGFLPFLKARELIKNKHIPDNYLFSCHEDRLALLQGLMDTDGTMDKNGKSACIALCHERLAHDVFRLIASLGMKPTMRIKQKKCQTGAWSTAYETTFKPLLCVFRLERKKARLKIFKPLFEKSIDHTIYEIKKVESRPVRCIKVDNPTSLFCITESFIPTHNTELAMYFLWRIAKTYPGVPCYFIAPLQTQAREIVWADPRIKRFGPSEWLLPGSQGINETEMRLKFTNGSFIKVDGSDNYNKYRGPKYKICVYEEFKDHRAEFRKAMQPNASVLNGIDLYIGSPPEVTCDYTTIADEHKRDKDKFFYRAPTWQNPAIPKGWLYKEKQRLYLRGEGDVWEREYAARFIKGGSSRIFPMLAEKIVHPFQDVLKMIHRDLNKLQFYIWNDPAGASCFATLFVAINPFTKMIYCLDEIYEQSQAEMTVERIGKRILSKRKEIYDAPDRYTMGYDEAATWFANEWIDNFPDEDGLQPTFKSMNKKEAGLSLIKDILLADRMIMTDRCKWLFWELDHMMKDKNGRIPKKDDHLVDCLRYLLASDGYSLKTEEERIKELDPDWRGSRIEDDFPHLFDGSNSGDWENYNA